MTTMKEAVAYFERITVVQTTAKVLQGSKAAMEVTSKKIFVGSGGNWTLKWKDVETLTFSDNDEGLTLCGNDLVVEANLATSGWGSCRRLLEKYFRKQQEQKRRQLLLKEEEQLQTRKPPKSYRGGKSYSKRPFGSTFLARNEANNQWDSEDDEIFNRVHKKKNTLGEAEIVEEESSTEIVEEEQEEAQAQAQAMEEEEDDDDDDMEQEATFDDDDDDLPQKDQEDDASMEEPAPRKQHPKKKRRIQRKQFDSDSEDDENLFDNPALTTPKLAKRIVSPNTAMTSPRHALLDDDDEGEQGETTMETVQEETKGMLTISNFFTPLVTQAANNNKHQSKSVVEKPQQQQQQQESSEKHQKQEPSPKKKAPKMDFFAPRRSNPKPVVLTRDDNDDVSTVVASPMDDKSAVVTTPRSHPKSSHAYESAKKLEREELQEDPILEDDKDDDLTAPSSTSRFVGKKRLFKNTYSKRTPKSKATMALELADARSPKRSPLAFAASTPKSPKRSPLTLAPEQQQSTWRGLRNLGNTCYLNSAMQMIFSVPDFLQALTTATVDNEKQHHLSSGILQLWQNLNDPQRTGAATPFKIKKAIDERTDKFRGYQQRDAHEFLGDLIDQIHEELEKPPQGEEKKEDDETKKLLLPTDEFFRLNVEVCLECKSCGYSRTKEEMYRYLSIDIADDSEQGTNHKRTVGKCLDHFFRPEERELKCEKCEEGTVATQTMRILSRPKAVLLHLKRFVMVEKPRTEENNTDPAKNNSASPGVERTFRKDKAPVELTEHFSLDRFLAKSAEKTSLGENYSLKSIVHHIGSTANSGHYTADALRVQVDESDTKKTWVSFDDGITSETTGEAVRESVKNQKSAYMLLYTTG